MITGNEPANPSMCNYNAEGEMLSTYEPGATPGYAFGLTIRQQFAAMAMQGICANDGCKHVANSTLAKEAVEIADALIAELTKAEV